MDYVSRLINPFEKDQVVPKICRPTAFAADVLQAQPCPIVAESTRETLLQNGPAGMTNPEHTVPAQSTFVFDPHICCFLPTKESHI